MKEGEYRPLSIQQQGWRLEIELKKKKTYIRSKGRLGSRNTIKAVIASEEPFFPLSLIPEDGELEKICRSRLGRVVKGHVFWR